MHDRVERIESVKAGSLSGIAAGLCYGAIRVFDRSIFGGEWLPSISLGLEVAIAIAGGCLFGVTYRYIIRTDRNNHLNSGAVLAFGLVRGLAQVDVSGLEPAQLLSDGVVVVESIVLFAIARYAIDYALFVSWIAPFKCQDYRQG
jgi:hypothetical protein